MRALITRLRIKLAADRFAKHRDDWYEYLADMISDSAGQRTLLRIFQADAARYGPSTARGLLSAHWAYGMADGGDLGHATQGTLPAREVADLATLQRRGDDILIDGLRDMASQVRLTNTLKSILKWTLLAGLVALAILWVVIMIFVPYVTAPELLAAFPPLDQSYYGPWASTFFGLAQWIRDRGIVLWLVSIGCLVALPLSFAHWDGRVRRWLDTWGPYRLYRDIQAVAVVSSLATALKARAGVSVPLREAISAQRASASRWLSARLQAMITKLDDVADGAAIFDVGLLDRESYWYLEDLADALGLDVALQKTRIRLETAMVKRIERRALVIRWILLLGSVAALLGILAWHYAVIFDLRSAMMLSSF
ncbi:general secretion pathway protein [Achromobacter pulmonis]|uniref:general secretion pathway protein n=1 Tax=Achromobacter pulmonis TaxID=1389932 RepID=UPI001F28A1E7|nr:general secretion pathway protein [Achromobacter pulmonis]MCF7767253.1 general secretion pathway protein [Achromobacter pulmonis]